MKKKWLITFRIILLLIYIFAETIWIIRLSFDVSFIFDKTFRVNAFQFYIPPAAKVIGDGTLA